MTKILVVFGTRPEAIKLAPVVQELQKRAANGCLNVSVCVTGQHRHMLDQILSIFDIIPAYDLDIMGDSQTLSEVFARVLRGLEGVLRSERPDWVIVQGDTTTVAAACLAAFYSGVKVCHVEAGLRTGDKSQPFPEEMNRRLASAIADCHFAPTESARQNLINEGVSRDHILVTGNTVIDALYWVSAQPPTDEVNKLLTRLKLPASGLSTAWSASPRKDTDQGTPNNEPRIILVTAHRRENFGQPLKHICLALRDIAVRYHGRVKIVYPVHLNPNVTVPVHQVLGNVPGITLVPPLDYLTFVHLMRKAYLVLTDSGGIQEEAPALGKPVLVLRDVTERPEAVEAGTVKVIGTDRSRVVAEVSELLDDPVSYMRMAQAVSPYGDGKAAIRIVKGLLGEPVSAIGSEIRSFTLGKQ